MTSPTTFATHEGKRYARLLEEVIGKGAKTQVLMLSATPVNTSLIDLRNQIYLMTESRQDTFGESLGVTDIGNLLKRTQTQFKQWESQAPANGHRDKSQLLDSLGSDSLPPAGRRFDRALTAADTRVLCPGY